MADAEGAMPDENFLLRLQPDWQDRFEADLIEPSLTPIQAAVQLLGDTPGWVRQLMRLRNAIVRLVGLKAVEMAAGEAIGGFPVLQSTDRFVVLGFDDHHLDFRIVLDLSSRGADRVVGVSTFVRRKNLLGKIYMLVVAPFHRRIVPATLRSLARNVRAVSLA